ncbi:MAG: membrane protein insertase YidC [Betaproteobacteria bacterium]
MDTFRLLAGMVFAVCVFLLVDNWVKDHAVKPVAPKSSATSPTVAPAPSSTVPNVQSPVASSQTGSAPSNVAPVLGERIKVTTDLYVAELDTAGGDVRRLELSNYRDTLDSTKNFVLFEETSEHTYVAQTGLIGKGLPNHTSPFKSANSAYALAPGEDTLSVQLDAQTDAGIIVTKTYTFHRGSYVMDVAFSVKNAGSTAIEPSAYFQLVRDAKPPAGDSKMVPTFAGAEVYTEKEKLHKASFEDIEKNKATYPKTAEDGWVAVVQHYFLGAWLPKPTVLREYFVRNLDGGLFAAGVIVPVGRIEPGRTAASVTQLYAGPQEQERLKSLAPGLELTVDYGWLRVLAVPLFWVLSEIHALVRNWGVAIILLTLLIKLAFYPLSAASYKSMAKMKVLAPKMQKLKERYGDDRQRMQQAMVELYKTEKINPLGGCLPIVVQIPVFIALYWVLLLSVELRQAPFALWIHDLSRPDPFFILPILMGATMFIQTWLNPTPPDPMQAKLMKIMPVAFSIFFFFFPSGLVLYWVVNNVLSIAQQWRITHVLERAKAAHGTS